MKKLFKFIKIQILVLIVAVILTGFLTEIFYDQTKNIIKFVKTNIAGKEVINDYMIPEDGIPVVDYGTIKNVYIGKRVVPIAVCQTALEHYDNFKIGNSLSYDKFLNCADWLLLNSTTTDIGEIYYYNFPFPLYDMTAPWRSAMVQGQALQVLAKAHELTKKQYYLDFADSLITPLFYSTKDGGVTHKLNDKEWWYEEYSDDHTGKIMVLNGMMYTLLGLHEYYTYTENENAKLLFDKGLTALMENIPNFDRSGHSYYDILKHKAGGSYHEIHINQLRDLYEITGEEILNEYSLKWNKFQNSPRIVQLLVAPPKMLLGVYLFIFITIFIVLQILTISLKVLS